jgi:AraC family transcriptional regulator, arabinose operon regulatory protein
VKETRYQKKGLIWADEFRQNASYRVWRSRGTPDWLFIYTVAGAGRAGLPGEETLLTPGTAILFEPDTPHSYLTDPEAGSWHLLWAHFLPRPHWQLWLHWPGLIMPGLRIAHVRDRKALREIRSCMAETARFGRQHFAAREEFMMNAFERALLWTRTAEEPKEIDERVRKAIDLLAGDVRQPFSLAKLAKACGLSISRLAHLFSEQIGASPQQYHENLRLERAAQLLDSSSLSISEIAEETGYANAFYFSNRFRKFSGQSPSQYRNRGASK